MERAVAALIPFVQEWGLALNPEDLAELAGAVFEHYDADETWEALEAAVREQIAGHRRNIEQIQASYRGQRRERLQAGGKRPFLVVDDYGTGGIWIYLYATSAKQITDRYPGLTVITDWREWMTPERVFEIAAEIGPDMTFDIDNPHGWLADSEDALRHPPT